MLSNSFLSLDEILSKIPLSALWIGFGIFVVISFVIGLALLFHWRKYKLYSLATDTTQIVYIIGLLTLIILCGISLSLFSIS